MGKPIIREIATSKTILKHFEHEAFATVIPATLGATVGAKKIVVAGTPIPANDATCKGLLLEDVDVTMGDAAGSVVFVGSIDNAKLTANGVTVAAEAKAACPRLTFFS